MDERAPGATYTWQGRVTDGPGGSLLDAAILTISVIDGGGNVVSSGNLSSGIVRDSVGTYHFNWAIPSGAAPGVYIGRWDGSSSAGVIEGSSSMLVVTAFVAPSGAAPVASYMTPGRFRTMGYGVNLNPYSDLELANVLDDAAALVNAYCNQPLLPYPGSFLGGRAVDEERRWKFPDSPTSRGTRRVYPKHWPIQTVEALKLVVGFDAGALLPLDSLVINNSEGWVEVTALTIANNSGLFGVSGWIVPMGGLIVPIAKITYTYGWIFPVVGERLRPVDADTKLIWQARNGFWAGAPTAVYVDGSPVSSTVDAEEGRVTFEEAPTGVVTIDYAYRLPVEIPKATGLIAAWLLGQSDLRRRGMSGLGSLRVNEIAVTRQQHMRGEDPRQVIDQQVPAAAQLLSGFVIWSQA